MQYLNGSHCAIVGYEQAEESDTALLYKFDWLGGLPSKQLLCFQTYIPSSQARLHPSCVVLMEVVWRAEGGCCARVQMGPLVAQEQGQKENGMQAVAVGVAVAV
mmetsp:Transcript_8005/g.12855  ORF Transcript_8005/g.12855 Transcript_8005/m.12855 type:complete len:104 (+) Transcript_8005:524-835(+)